MLMRKFCFKWIVEGYEKVKESFFLNEYVKYKEKYDFYRKLKI